MNFNQNLNNAVNKNMGKNVSYFSQLCFINAICTLGVATFHFAAAINPQYIALVQNANARWGRTIVSCFFVTSGYKLLNSYNKIDKSKIILFYYNRWKRLFPAFYMAYAYFFLRSAIVSGTFNFRNDNLWKLLLTFFGMDGYVQSLFSFSGYHMVGEWYLGAIILVYISYPITLWLFNKIGVLLLLPLIASVYIPVLSWGGYISLGSCLIPFVVGMLMVKTDVCNKSWFKFVGIIFFVFLAQSQILCDG